MIIFQFIILFIILVATSENVQNEPKNFSFKRGIDQKSSCKAELQKEKTCISKYQNFQFDDSIHSTKEEKNYRCSNEPIDLCIKKPKKTSEIDHHKVKINNIGCSSSFFCKKRNRDELQSTNSIQSNNQIPIDTVHNFTSKKFDQIHSSLSNQSQIIQENEEYLDRHHIVQQKNDLTRFSTKDSSSKSENDYIAFPSKHKSFTHMELSTYDKNLQIFYGANKRFYMDKCYEYVKTNQKPINFWQSGDSSKENLRKAMIGKQQVFLDNRQFIIKNNLNFIKAMCFLFICPEKELLKDNTFEIYRNLKSFLQNQIEIMKPVLKLKDLRNIKTFPSKIIEDESKLVTLCPFCSTQPLQNNDFEEIEHQLLNDCPKFKIGRDFAFLLQKLFEQISSSFDEAFKLESLFSCEFFEPQRLILDDLLLFVKSNKVMFGSKKRLKYLHIVYHKLFLINVDIKSHYLPELQSIMYVLLRTSLRNHLISTNRNFIILFYSFYALDKFFDWISDYHEKHLNFDNPIKDFFLRFVSGVIPFILRISFIEPIFALLSIHKNAQMRYHFLSLTIFHDDISIFLSMENHANTIAHNSRKLIPFIILVDKFLKNDEFDFLLEFDIHRLVFINRFNFVCMQNFMQLIKAAKIFKFDNRLQELEIFLDFHLSWS